MEVSDAAANIWLMYIGFALVGLFGASIILIHLLTHKQNKDKKSK